MTQVLRIKFGSHLYGTSTPSSDLDFKSVFIPDARSILLQRAKGTMNSHRPKGDGEKNYAGEVDEEKFSLQRFLGLVAEGQTVALDILFAPAWATTDAPSWHWQEIQNNRGRLLTRRSAAFLGYARQQANKYGIKGSRVAAGRAALSMLATALSSNDKLSTCSADIEQLCRDHPEHMAIAKDTTPHGQTVLLWEVCNRKMPYTASIKNAHDIMARVVDEYGKRALMAETQQGIDWKALSHAVRVGNQAIEVLQSGFVTFPLPNAAHILEIKLGKLLYQNVAAEIEDLLLKVEAAAAASSLPTEPDLEWIDEFVASAYRDKVMSSLNAAADYHPLERRALAFATAAHASIDQRRKYTGEPYIVHPIAVADIVRGVPHLPEMIAAAYLHDVVEDTPVGLSEITDQFGPNVAYLVECLTDISRPSDGNRSRRKQLDLEHIAKAPTEAKTIKLADLIDNTISIRERDPDFWRVYRHEKLRLLEVLKDGDQTLWQRAYSQCAAEELAAEEDRA